MSDLFQALHRRLNDHLQLLPDKPEETVDSTLRALWHTAAGNPTSAVQALQVELPALDAGRGHEHLLESLVARRLAGTPLSHLTGRVQFMGMELLAGPQALVPRKETELLAHAAVAIAQQLTSLRARMTIVDVCTGSGNVALAVAHHVPDVRVHGSDLSAEAIALARQNALHLNLDQRAEFHVGDFMAPFEAPHFICKVDLLICNPPYIGSKNVDQLATEIAAHEPRLAFDGGAFGVALLMRLLDEAPRFLRPDGWLAFEVGLNQGPALVKRLQRNSHYTETRALSNAVGAVRTIVARRK